MDTLYWRRENRLKRRGIGDKENKETLKEDNRGLRKWRNRK